jgi:transcriptional regulator with PAS, ATPase and Fis domain
MSAEPASPGVSEFGWQSLFQCSRQPLFLLDHQRRILLVNQAWESLTGLPGCQVRGQCAEPGVPDAVLRALTPPVEVLDGRPARARRLIAGLDLARSCWDIDFFPLSNENDSFWILGRINPVNLDPASGPLVLSERLVALRDWASQQYRIDLLGADGPSLRQVADQVRLVAQNRVPVLLVGEPGTGKQWLARTIHHHGPNREKPFAALDCAHLPPEALTAVLFGDGPGSKAAYGTLYLKEPGSLPRDLQSRLSLHLNSGETTRPTAPRWIAGSTVELEEEVRQGRLLEELRCSLSTVVIRLPPLRDRPADLPLLAEQLLERGDNKDGRKVSGLTPAAWELMRAHRWPGNLRELYAVLTAALAHAAGEFIDVIDLPPSLRRAARLEQTLDAKDPRPLPLDRLLEEAERRLILLALERTRGHKARAADLLEIPRPRLFRRMKALGLRGPDEAVEEGGLEIDDSEK